MPKDHFRVLIIEDDPYASDLMLMLLSRDYRVHVAGELSHQVNLAIFDSPSNPRDTKRPCKDNIGDDYFDIDLNTIDVVILDTEVPWDVDLPIKIIEKISGWTKPPKILCTCTYPNIEIMKKLSKYNCFSGYLLKREILYSIASAACLAAEDYFIITPGIVPLVEKERGGKTLILISREMEKIREELNKIGREIVRLGLLFNLPHYDISDELCISETWVSEIMSKEYLNLQVPGIISEAVSLDELFDNPYIDNNKIIHRYQKILNDLPKQKGRRHDGKKNPRFRNMSTLAFHLLTRPEIKEWR